MQKSFILPSVSSDIALTFSKEQSFSATEKMSSQQTLSEMHRLIKSKFRMDLKE